MSRSRHDFDQTMARRWKGRWHDGGQPVDGTELAFSDRTDLIRPQSLHTPPPIHASMLTISWHQSSTCLSGVRKSIHFFWKYAKDICHFQHDLICNFARDVYKTCKMCKKMGDSNLFTNFSGMKNSRLLVLHSFVIFQVWESVDRFDEDEDDWNDPERGQAVSGAYIESIMGFPY